jgi:two-component system response regulator RegX3
VERAELLERVWGTDDLIASRTLDVHVGRLRKKIEADPAHPRLIVTVPRLGYRIAA